MSPTGRARAVVGARLDEWRRRPFTSDTRLLVAVVSVGLTLLFLFYAARGPTAGDRLVALVLAVVCSATAAWELWEAKGVPRSGRGPDS